MSTRVESQVHFGVPILETFIAGYDSDRRARISEHILDLRARDNGLNRSNQNGWHSANNLFRSEHADLRWLIQQIYAVSTASIRQMENKQFDGDIPMTECWANVNDAGSWNAPHLHLPNEWSGVFYVAVEEAAKYRKAPSLDGDLLLLNPTPGGPQYNRPPFTSYSPKDGQLYLFPGYMLHMVSPHQAPVPRISIAFNFKLVPKGVLPPQVAPAKN